LPHAHGQAVDPMVVDSEGAVTPAGPAASAHHFVWDNELSRTLEQRAVKMDFWEKRDLAAVAKGNYQLVKRGGYEDPTGRRHKLSVSHYPNRTHTVPPTPGRPLTYRFARTTLCVARMDTATAVRALGERVESRVACLNFANQHHRGGGYLNGAHAQEEDLCRLMPALYSQLGRLKYPLDDGQAHFTRTLLARTAGSYDLDGAPVEVDVISAAMPNLGAPRVGMHPGGEKWVANVRLRMRAVLHAAREESCNSLVLGAFGCGAFRNPPASVAHLFKQVLDSDEFRGAFETVVFAILEPKQCAALKPLAVLARRLARRDLY
jgi:uncharacterized protein (TIGR02452 family)